MSIMKYVTTLEVNPRQCYPTADNKRPLAIEEPLDDTLAPDHFIYELAGSILELGQAQTGCGRNRPPAGAPARKRQRDEEFVTSPAVEIRAGEQRWLACILADVPYRIDICEMTDKEAYSITVIENLKRQNLPPIVEATYISDMLTRGWTQETIATELGVSVSWVARRGKLAGLIEPWKALADGELATWPIINWETIARYPAETQTQMLAELEGNYHTRTMTAADLREYVRREIENRLDEAPWPLEVIGLAGKHSCLYCPQRSSCNPMLFPELEPGAKVTAHVEDEDDIYEDEDEEWDEDDGGAVDVADEAPPARESDRCLNVVCYEAKFRAWYQERIDAARREHGDELPVLCKDWQLRVRLKELGVDPGYDWNVFNAEVPESRPALVFERGGLATMRWAKAIGSSRGDQPKGPKTQAEKEAELHNRRLAWCFGDQFKLLKDDGFLPGWLQEDGATERLLHLLTAFGTGSSEDGLPKSGKAYERLDPVTWLADCKRDDGERRRAAFGMVCRGILEAWERNHGMSRAKGSNLTTDKHAQRDVEWLAELLELDWQDLWDRACQKHKRPKSWPPEMDEDAKQLDEQVKALTKGKKGAKGKGAGHE